MATTAQQTTIHHNDSRTPAEPVRVVRTEPVRATEQRWWGRTDRTFIIRGDETGGTEGNARLRQLLDEVQSLVLGLLPTAWRPLPEEQA